MAYEYAQQTWNTKEAITKSKMNHIEEGIKGVSDQAKTNAEALNTLQTNSESEDAALWNAFGYGRTSLQGKTIKQYIDELTIPSGLTSTVEALKTEIQDARMQGYSPLSLTLSHMRDLTDQAQTAANTANNAIGEGFGTNNTIANVIENINTTLNNAKTNNFTTLAGRINSLDSRIGTNEGNITNINNWLDNPTEDDISATLLLKEIIDAHRTGADNLNARFESIDDALGDINGNDENTLKTQLGRVKTEVEAARVSAANGNVSYTSIDNRIEADEGNINAIQTEINDAHRSAINNDTLDKRFDDIETAIDHVQGEEDEIPNGLKQRMTAAESAIDTLEGTTIPGLETRLGAIDGGSAFDSTNGTLAQHMSVAEASIDNIESSIGSGFDSINTVAAAINAKANSSDMETALAAKANASEVNAALATKADTTTVNAISTTIVVDNTKVNFDTDDRTPISFKENSNITLNDKDDYLIQENVENGKYYYWKHINNEWHLMGGAGNGEGGGTSSAEFYAALTDVLEPSDTVDYFIGSGTYYIHYRYRNNTWVQILPNHLINNVTVDITPVGEGEDAPTKSRPVITEIGSNTNLLANFNAIQSIHSTNTDAGTTLSWVNIDGEVEEVTITGGGGGGSSSNITAFINRITGNTTNGSITTISGESCVINYIYSATERIGNQDELIATTGIGVWSINGARVATQDVTINDSSNENDYNTFDIGQYLRTGTNNITLKVTIVVNDETINRTKTWVVNVVNFSLTWDYEESTINNDSTINFSCTPYGTDITKTLYLKVGSYQQTQTVTTSGIPTIVTLANNFEHGTYTAEMWMTATINGVAKETPHITHDFLVVEAGNNTPIIAATLPSSTIDQYNTISIPFVIYTPNSSLSTVILAVDDIVQDTRTEVNRNTQIWNYTPSTSGNKVLTITSGTTSKTLNLTVNSVNIDNVEIGGYSFKLKANELASNNALQAWHYDDSNVNATKLQFSNNFDWINGGIKTEYDENGQLRQYIRIKSGTTMTIPYKMFTIDPKRLGSNFKIIFKIENCRDYDAIVATTMADNIGIQLNAHNATFKSTTTSISTQYGENEYTELEFEVYKNHIGDTEVEAANPYMMAWIDGVITSARPYDGNFVQNTPSNIIIGSNDCDVCVYLVKYYPTVLTIADHITNFIADAPNAVEMVRRYNRNDILDEDGDIDFNALAIKNPDCRVWLYDIPRMTTGKKDYVGGVGFQQIYKNGTAYQDGLHGVGTLTVQGTSSVNYRKGAANTDINFYDTKDEGRLALCELYDGENNNLLSDNLEVKGFKINTNSTPITYSNMKVNFASCEQVNNMCNAEWYQQFQPYPSLSPRDCMEFAMGVQFIHDKGENEPSGEVILFNEKGANRNPNKYYMYSIGNLGTSKKNTHIFHSDNECCIEVNNNENAGCRMISVPADLQADYTAYLNANYNGMSNYDWSGDTDGKDHSYGMRFPDTKNPEKEIKAGWARFVKWMAENNPNAATNASIATETYAPYTFKGHKRVGTQVLQGTTITQYAGTYTTDSFERRMAKMLSECEDYMAMDSVIYHFLFIERHTMVDNVSKNTFWSAAKTNQYINGVEQSNTEGYWIWDLSKNYDNDTSDGNNNEGQLIFDYGNEATDRQDGKAVFNASDAVWFVFASNLYEACRTMFQNREGADSKNGKWHNAWNASAYHTYLLEEQRKVPERVWNECYWYDYLRTFETGKVREASDVGQIIDKSWITFLDGGQKIHQRWHYETFEELYDASKYRSNFSTANAITFRGYTPDDNDPSLLAVPAKSEIAIKMYNKCYLTAHFGDNIQTQKVQKGVLTTLQFLEDNNYMKLSDTVINIDTASMIQEIGDLAPLYPGQASFGAAIRLRSIKIGDSTEGYNNPHITNTETGTVTFGANAMLEHLEVQNLSNANQPLDLKDCPAVTYLDAHGSSFTSITFANGGLLNEAYVNNPTSLIMRNLDYLTLANFHLTDATAVTQLRLEGCKLFDKQTFVESLINLDVLRLSGINWTLSNTTILDNLLNIMGMDELGYTINQSYLAGTVTLTGTVYEGNYDKYTQAWSPDLTINTTGSFIHQHLVTYYNYDGTKLYETYINSGGYDGQYLIDPQALGLLESIPTKPADVENVYTFGKVDNAEYYIPFSGWREEESEQSIYQANGNNSSPNISVVGDMNLYAVYSSTKQKYKVRWLLDANRVVAESAAQNYGSGYDLIAPSIKDVQALYPTVTFSINGTKCTYSIMTGWEKLPTNITPTEVGSTYDIYATWLRRENVDYNTVLTSDDYSTEEKLLVLQKVANARNSLAVKDKFSIQLGYNGLKPAIDLISTPTRKTGTATTINDYEPFASGKSFTMAIDYRFEAKTSTQASEAVLLSCYSETDEQGFKLYYNPQGGSLIPQISFGSTASSTTSNIRSIGSSITNRNVVVLRHRAGENILYVYSGSTASGLISEYSSSNFKQTIEWSANASNAKIVLGGINTNNLSSMNATGTLYSVKYWEEDLGEGECLQLASWCHETIDFAVTDYDGNEVHSSIMGNDFKAKIVLHTLNASEMGTYTIPQINRTTETTIGWNPSDVRTLYNNRIYYGLPTLLQSVMIAATIPYKVAQYNDGAYSLIASTTSTSSDYVFAPSCIEVGASSQSHSTEANGAFGWYSGDQFTVQRYNNNTLELQSSGDANYTNLRFPYCPLEIDKSTTIYTNYPITGSSFYAWLQEKAITLKTGDILIPAGESVAYMYVSSAEINKGAPIIEPPSDGYLADTIGGWIESIGWWTRSVPTTTSSTSVAKFQYINDLGVITTNNDKTHGIVYSIGI